MNDEILTGIDIQEQEEHLEHYGRSVTEGAPGVGSGRYPLGSGSASYQHEKNFQTMYRELQRKGMNPQDIAKHLQLRNTSELRSRVSKSKGAVEAYERAMILKLHEKGMSNTAIAMRLFKDANKESTVRNRLKEAMSRREDIFKATEDVLKKALEEHPYLDVGAGTELYLGVSATRLKNVLQAMEKEGYKVHSDTIQVEQYGIASPQKTTIKVLTKEGVTPHEVYEHLDDIWPAGYYSDDGGEHYRKIEPPSSISSDRVYIKYAENGGKDKDGVIEIRPGVADLSLGDAHYAQVRIAVDDTHYLKGMALYSDNIPPGYDIVFNTNKTSDIPKIGPAGDKNCVLKPLKDDPANPFGASIKGEDQLMLARQRHYIDEDGNEKLSAINIVNEEGNWNEWSRTISAQMLSKQPPALAKRQLDLTYQLKREQLNDILSLTNPTVKQKLLIEFADGCDSDAVHLKAFGFPGQASKVILPITSMPENQIYDPSLPTGTQVVCIRFPHAGRFEIPSLTVNNDHPEAKKILGQAIDAVGINQKVAQHLSGADFDGDTVIVIPNNSGDIQHMKPLTDLKDFDPQEQYKGYPGMKVLSKSYQQKQMGIVTNLITDMTIAGAPMSDIAKAVKHSMVIIDANKHELDWKRSEKENDILALKEKYQVHQDGKVGGASTLISRAKSKTYIDQREKKGIDPETGEQLYRLTGKTNFKGDLKQQESTQMADTKDARTLISKHNAQIENIYADFANKLKAMANEARKEYTVTQNLKYDPEARKYYAKEVADLTLKLKEAKMNAPLERRAQILANVAVKLYLYQHPEMKDDYSALKKLKGRTLNEKRALVGANKHRVTFTESEWRAIQSGAVTHSFLSDLLKNADDKTVKQLSMPRTKTGLTSGQEAMIRSMLSRNYTQAEIASALDIPLGQVENAAIKARTE